MDHGPRGLAGGHVAGHLRRVVPFRAEQGLGVGGGASGAAPGVRVAGRGAGRVADGDLELGQERAVVHADDTGARLGGVDDHRSQQGQGKEKGSQPGTARWGLGPDLVLP